MKGKILLYEPKACIYCIPYVKDILGSNEWSSIVHLVNMNYCEQKGLLNKKYVKSSRNVTWTQSLVGSGKLPF